MTEHFRRPEDMPAPSAVPPATPTRIRFAHAGWLLAGLVMVALNLRPPLSSFAPLLPDIRADLGMSVALAGLLTTLAVVCLGLFGPLAPRLAQRFGMEMTILFMLLLIAFGVGLRGIASIPVLFIGTVLAAAGIAVSNVLMPAIVKRDFAGRAGSMMGLYTLVLCLGAGAGAGFTVPVERMIGHGWQPALMFWALPALVAAVVWLPQVFRAAQRRAAAAATAAPAALANMRQFWREKLAWQVTGFMGLQSALAYIVMGWLPVIFQDRGLDPIGAGFAASASMLCQMLTGLLVPMLAPRRRDQRGLVLLTMGLTFIGLVGCIFAPIASLWLWAVVLGLGQGGSFGLALTIIVLRSRDAHVAAHLSSMAQSVGYTLASLGPFVGGLLRQMTGDWHAAGIFFLAITVLCTLCGLGAGRNLFVLSRSAD